jgi:RNA polymerase sigma factor (sigma-70 family)
MTNDTTSFKALEALIQEYKSYIYSLPVHVFRFAPEIADDVFQEVCLKLVRYADSLGDMAHARRLALIRKITYTVCVDHYRFASRVVFMPDENILDILDSDAVATPHADPQRNLIIKDMLQAAIACLSESQRRVFMMRFVKDMGIRDIASFLNKTPLAVRQDLYRIRRRIQAA